MSIKNYFTKKQNTYLKVLQLRYCGRDSIIQVRNRPYFHYGPFGRTKNKMEVAQTYKTVIYWDTVTIITKTTFKALSPPTSSDLTLPLLSPLVSTPFTTEGGGGFGRTPCSCYLKNGCPHEREIFVRY